MVDMPIWWFPKVGLTNNVYNRNAYLYYSMDETDGIPTTI